MKKTAAILLLFFVFLYTGGGFIAFHIRKAEIKNEVKAFLLQHSNACGEFLKFKTENNKIASADFEWAEENEFLYNGRMYDVISITYKNDHAIVHCIKDEDESKLRDLYAQMHKGTEKSSSSQNSLKFFGQLFFLSEEKIDQPIAGTKLLHITSFSTRLSRGFTGADEKPPSKG